jgi:hypothetical protein
MKIEANCTTGEVIEREMTDAEIAQDLANQAKAELQAEAEAAKAADKAALLAKLGITEDEARLLLG